MNSVWLDSGVQSLVHLTSGNRYFCYLAILFRRRGNECTTARADLFIPSDIISGLFHNNQYEELLFFRNQQEEMEAEEHGQ